MRRGFAPISSCLPAAATQCCWPAGACSSLVLCLLVPVQCCCPSNAAVRAVLAAGHADADNAHERPGTCHAGQRQHLGNHCAAGGCGGAEGVPFCVKMEKNVLEANSASQQPQHCRWVQRSRGGSVLCRFVSSREQRCLRRCRHLGNHSADAGGSRGVGGWARRPGYWAAQEDFLWASACSSSSRPQKCSGLRATCDKH